MIKVKEYLDENFISYIQSSATLKDNGHYNVTGSWGYPKGYPKTENENWIVCHCNNETLQINVIIDGKGAGYYGYLQTYEHLPRNGPDQHGYYVRSTDEEVIRYIDQFYSKINILNVRMLKIKKLKEIYEK